MRRCGGPSGFSAFSHQQVCLTGPNQSGTVHAVCMCFSVGCVRACLYAVVPRCVSARAGQCGLKIILPYLYAVLRCATVAEAGCLRGRAPAVCGGAPPYIKGTRNAPYHHLSTMEHPSRNQYGLQDLQKRGQKGDKVRNKLSSKSWGHKKNPSSVEQMIVFL